MVLSATTQSNDDDHDGSWKKVAGGAAAFVTGLGFMAQVAFADPASIEFSNHGKYALFSYCVTRLICICLTVQDIMFWT